MRGHLSVLIFFSLLCIGNVYADAQSEIDQLVFGYIENDEFEELEKAVKAGKITPTYVFPGGQGLVPYLITVGAVDVSERLLSDYWPILKYTSPKSLTAACLNDRVSVMSLLFDLGVMEQRTSQEAVNECLVWAVAECKGKQMKLLLKHGATIDAEFKEDGSENEIETP